MKFVVLSPHRDDAALSLGLTIEGWFRTGHVVSVLNCFTKSSYAPYSDVGALHANDQVSFVTALRRREDQAWNKLLANHITFQDLDLLDAPLRLGCTPDEVLTVDIRPGDRALSRVVGAIAKAATKLSPDKVCFVAPLAVGGHIDHRLVREAAQQALAEQEFPLAFYEDLPYAARGDAAVEVPALAAQIGGELTPAFALEAPDSPDEARLRKRKFAESYDSQIDSIVVDEIAGFCLRYNGRERIWVNAAWRRSGLLEDVETSA